MARKKASKEVSEEQKKHIFDLKSAGMRVIDMNNFYYIPQATVSNIIRRCKKRKKNHLKRKEDQNLNYQNWDYVFSNGT